MNAEQIEIKNFHGREPLGQSFTFVVTEFCNLNCSYCYQVKKNNKSVMTFDVAKKAVDFILEKHKNDSVSSEDIMFDFIGGEPLLEIDLIDKICDYIKIQLYTQNHPFLNNYRFGMTTNGILYNDPRVRKFIDKNKEKLGITISIDGIKEKHDLNRVRLDGSGTYDDVEKNVKLWLKDFPHARTKVTFASDDLKYLKDSIIHLWNLGIKYVPANLVYEDVWKEGDEEILEQQMKELADYIIDNDIPSEYKCSLFDQLIGYPLASDAKSKNWCTSGERMLAVDFEGNLYPCIRFLSFCFENKKPYVIGNVYEGINEELLRPFKVLDYAVQSEDKCLNCDVAMGCGWCQGLNYENAKSNTINERSIYICEMHKARCRANDYYFEKLNMKSKYKVQIPQRPKNKFMFFLMSNKSVEFCNYKNNYDYEERMTFDDFKKGLEYAKHNFLVPIIVHDENKLEEQFINELKYIPANHIVPHSKKAVYGNDIVVINSNEDLENLLPEKNVVLIVNNNDIPNIFKNIMSILNSTSRVNIVLKEPLNISNVELEYYERELEKVADKLVQLYKDGIHKEVNVLTDTLVSEKMLNCNAGITSVTLAPNGKFYICPAFYYEDVTDSIGDFNDGVNIINKHLLTLDKAPICKKCDAYHCKRCVYCNKCGTREINIPSSVQCKISHIERKISLKLQRNIMKLDISSPLTRNILKEIDYDDPIKIIKIR